MTIAAAPVPASELPDVPPASSPRGGHSEAKIIACILAENVSPLACLGLDITEGRVRYIVATTLQSRTHVEILAWRQRVPGPEWATRWEGARRVVAAHYCDLPGALDLPEFYEVDFGDETYIPRV